MEYTKTFKPEEVVSFVAEGATPGGVGDQRSGSVYVYNEDIVLAVNVALATRRPLLVRGPSGGGKSSLARNVANFLKYRYYETVISSRTQARDLLWEVDLLRRLHDAQIRKGAFSADMTRYIVPGVLWWAFNRESALRRRTSEQEPGEQQYPDAPRAVVLLDEIDKADPDVPNNLLVPLGSLQFRVEETGESVETTRETAPLVFITTNGERELPTAFLRRCVEVELPATPPERLKQIGRAHFPGVSQELLDKVADQISQTLPASGKAGDNMPSPAEYLDTLRACYRLEINSDSEAWEKLVQMTLWKQRRPGGQVEPKR
ncbi:MAG TPA: MoxR family ATPase [Pyrinomonadaceae bacterium]|nr:MoxR family ATPase [Pyrinomonadaceae bacterium]